MRLQHDCSYLLAAQGGGGQIGEIARTFGVDWPHLGAQIISFGIVCAVLYKFAYRPVLAMLEQRRQQIAHGLANAEKIKAELDRDGGPAPGSDGGSLRRVGQIDRGSSRRGRTRARTGNPIAIAAAEQIMIKAREAAAQDHDRMLAELKREVGRLVVSRHHNGDRQDPDSGRPTAAGRGDRKASSGLAMITNRQAKREAKQLFHYCLVNGVIDENRVRQVANQ